MAFSMYKAETYGSGSFNAKPLSGDNARCGQMVLPYKIRVDPICQTPVDVLSQIRASGFTMPGDVVSTNDDWVVAKIAPRHVPSEGQDFWQADVTLEPNPLRVQDEVQIQATRYQEAVYKDQKTGQVFKNTAGVYFEKGFEESKGRGRMEITRNLSERDSPADTTIANILYHKNVAGVRFAWRGFWYSFPPETLYLGDIRCPFLWDPAPHYRVTSVFEIDMLGKHVRHPINVGYDEKVANGRYVAGHDSNGVKHGRPILLGQDGKKLAEGYEPIFLDCETVPTVDLNLYHLFPGT